MAGAGVPVSVPVPNPAQCYPPSLPELDARARLTEGTGPVDGVAVDWVCTNTAEHAGGCNVTNPPIDNFLLKLPALYCSGCGKLNPTGYRWKMTHCRLGTVSLHLLIRDQGPHNTCVAHAIVTGMDLMTKIYKAYRFDFFYGRPLSLQDLFKTFNVLYNVSFGYEDNFDMELGRSYFIIDIAQRFGVRLSAPSLSTECQWNQVPEDRLKMGSFFHVPAHDTGLIVRLIAGGFPLICGMRCGRTFRFTTEGEIYDGGEVGTSHCVLLIGSGVLNYPGNPARTKTNKYSRKTWPLNPNGKPGPRVCLGARGSWGDQAHGSSSQEGGGGDFYIWADQIDRVMGFHMEGMY
ncbi:hypothetical protein CFC21_054546 [Triticum aestivum]|uniref:Uncharacterized protein n=3 Tax=Triticum TaxID=4564 RepID=A0A9R0W4L0_TRITD|nr:uncharacterized protein LOC123082908 [Triticum aestivum]KAF7045441.1 hypothetical protein CFC21_054546 [Triticum aestivum]VAH98501.1 unnamed protein product [Triticum turgidum subsp. durum]